MPSNVPFMHRYIVTKSLAQRALQTLTLLTDDQCTCKTLWTISSLLQKKCAIQDKCKSYKKGIWNNNKSPVGHIAHLNNSFMYHSTCISVFQNILSIYFYAKLSKPSMCPNNILEDVLITQGMCYVFIVSIRIRSYCKDCFCTTFVRNLLIITIFV